MPKIAADGQYLTVLNLFSTDAPEKQESLLGAMYEIVDAAAYPGWISSTVHSGVDRPGTANFIQWRSTEDLEARYAGEEFKHRTLPLFGDLTTSIRLLQNDVVHVLTDPKPGGVIEISPNRDDYTVIEVLTVAQENQDELIDALGPSQEWLLEVPGFRSQVIMRGLRARGLDGLFVASYAQWDSKEAYDAFRTSAVNERPAARQRSESRIDALAVERDINTYQVVHTRSA